ncbi:MAG: glycosyltransferase family 2 protein [Oscillospiraceae bacterium]|nr:glycosyltransferase family 2 protein [Oscillospiraceae bacterium]
MNSLSIVVPIFNEAENVVRLHEEIRTVCDKLDRHYEIIFVDDGSTDGTAEVARKLSPLKLICLRRNFGQTAAMDAGIKAAENDYIVTMDGDCQNDPADISRLISHLEENNLDIVSGWRKNRKDSFLKRFTSRGANLLRYIMVHDNIHDSGCSLKIYKRECFEGVNLYGEMHRFIPALLKIKGFTIGEIVVNHRPRTAGKTKYNWKRTIKGFLDMISVWFWHKYAVRPLHLMGTLGIVMLLLGAASGVWTTINFIRGQSLTDDFQAFLTITFIAVGLFLLVFGLIADVLVKIYYGNKIDMPYSVKEVFESDETGKD